MSCDWGCVTKYQRKVVISLHASKVLHLYTLIFGMLESWGLMCTKICEASKCVLSHRSKRDMILNLSIRNKSFLKIDILHGDSGIQIQCSSLIVSYSSDRERRISSSPPGKLWSQIFKKDVISAQFFQWTFLILFVLYQLLDSNRWFRGSTEHKIVSFLILLNC